MASSCWESNSSILANEFVGSQYDEGKDELDERRLYSGSEDWNAVVVVQRPPPKPPDLNSVAVGEGEPTSSVVTAVAGSCRIEGWMIHSAVEDGTVAKGNVNSTKVELVEVENDVDDGTEINAEVGASAKEKRRTIVAGIVATMTDGGLWARRLMRFVFTPLVAVVIPWDSSGGPTGSISQWWSEALAENRA
ncbi:hypothetical protein PIB30_073847 [Stylosanthes scabra]|uniref:Uncharacterized protein n=1 Tax=Stylosanthes scabra TaxID=79078 RepID=A0ABU6XP78_9FABA|nr:hypothetical protein [Stylosanthes scabra]